MNKKRNTRVGGKRIKTRRRGSVGMLGTLYSLLAPAKSRKRHADVLRRTRNRLRKKVGRLNAVCSRLGGVIVRKARRRAGKQLASWVKLSEIGLRMWNDACIGFQPVVKVLADRVRDVPTGFAVMIGLVVILIGRSFKFFSRKLTDGFAEGRFRAATGGERRIPLLSRVLLMIVDRRMREYLIGDLEEQFRTEIIVVQSRFRARLWWWRQVFGIVVPYAWKRLSHALGLEAVVRWRRR